MVTVNTARVGLSTVTVLTARTGQPGANCTNDAEVVPCCQWVFSPVTVTVTTPPCGPLAGETTPITAPDGCTVKGTGRFTPPELSVP